MQPAHVHEAGDGRPPRHVWLDGELLKAVVYADEKRGMVRCLRQPLQLDKHGKRCLSFVLRGKVVVKPISQTVGDASGG